MASNFIWVIQTLENQGLTDVLLPFLLIFTIVFAVFQKTEILGKGKKNFNGVIALVIALATVSFQAVKAARANPVEALRYE